MKKITVLLFVFLLPFLSEAKNLWAFLTYASFSSPQGPYVETYLTVAGNTVKYLKKENGKYQASVNILITFKQKNVIKAFKKYELNSPEIDDSSKNDYQFIDEQRFQVANGTYDFEIQMSDKNKDVKPQPFTQVVTVDFPADKPAVSGIELLQSYTKSETVKTITKCGFDLVPYVYNFYPSVEKKLSFYCELYNIDKVIPAGQKYVVSYYVEAFENNIRLSDYANIKKVDVKPLEPLIAEFNIAGLSTGNYNLVIEARNQKNELIVSRKSFFQRSNPGAAVVYTDFLAFNAKNTFAENMVSIDTLREYISSTYPISSGIEKSFIKGPLKTGDLKTLQQYFYGFWQRRNSQEPEKGWLAYKEQVHKAQINFGSKIKKGYQTDRGRVYLQYGAPNTRTTQYNDPNNYPYEIWHYYKLGNNQSNKKFVFFTEDLALGDFTLLHSDAIGEVNTPGWQRSLRGRVNDPGVLQETETVRSWGDFSDDYWKLPN
ncbi:MAG: GWxTD domain-containing protein [Bacteroidetes bacterium]|nr:GWxTD domain-containing protein [Bacteroidota bacterium]